VMQRRPSIHYAQCKQNSKLLALQEEEHSTYFPLVKRLQARLHVQSQYHSCKVGGALDGSMLRKILLNLVSSKDLKRNSKEVKT